MSYIVAYTDGGSRIGGTGASAWAYRLTMGDYSRSCSGAVWDATNNQMELMAIIECLKAMKRKDIPIEIRSDSAYCINGITTWVHSWKKNGWKTSKKQPVENKELWVELDTLVGSFYSVTFTKVKGHSGEEGNEFVDALLNKAMDKLELDKEDNEWLDSHGFLED